MPGTFLNRISHRLLAVRPHAYSATILWTWAVCGSVDRVYVGVGGPIDFLAHVKAAREKAPFSTDHPQPPTTLFDLPISLTAFLLLCCRLRAPSLVFSVSYALRCVIYGYTVSRDFLRLKFWKGQSPIFMLLWTTGPNNLKGMYVREDFFSSFFFLNLELYLVSLQVRALSGYIRIFGAQRYDDTT